MHLTLAVSRPLVSDYPPTRVSVACAKARMLRDRAEVLDHSHDPAEVVQRFTYPEYVSLVQLDELRSLRVAEEVAATLYDGQPLDQLPATDERECRFGATYAVRRPLAAWLAAACKASEGAIEAVLQMEVGSLFAMMPKERRQVVAAMLRQAAIAGWTGVLEGTAPISPADRLRIEAGNVEQEVR